MRILIGIVLVSSLVIGGCAASTASEDQTGTVMEIVDVAGGATINGLITLDGTEGYLANVALEDGTTIEAELSGFADSLQITTGETKVVVEQQAGKWVVLDVSK